MGWTHVVSEFAHGSASIADGLPVYKPRLAIPPCGAAVFGRMGAELDRTG